ncbi:NAD(P)-dependent oxidoreductase [Corynebacterium glutamicum]|uniref:NAD(P)-dependent oxidoreductase n=1 Tax=Corynebacterium glutamicum TaxID=1718 RepID=UPI0020B8D74E|nr:NAD(P)-dependent oxidoreductase [Corynebacterium glutamicum]
MQRNLYPTCTSTCRRRPLVLCVPLTADTYHLIGKAELKAMQSTAILINVARGEVVYRSIS